MQLGGDAMLAHIPYCATTKRRIFTSFCISLAPAAAASIVPPSLLSTVKAQLPGQRTRYTFWEFDEVGLVCHAFPFNVFLGGGML